MVCCAIRRLPHGSTSRTFAGAGTSSTTWEQLTAATKTKEEDEEVLGDFMWRSLLSRGKDQERTAKKTNPPGGDVIEVACAKRGREDPMPSGPNHALPPEEHCTQATKLNVRTTTAAQTLINQTRPSYRWRRFCGGGRPRGSDPGQLEKEHVE